MLCVFAYSCYPPQTEHNTSDTNNSNYSSIVFHYISPFSLSSLRPMIISFIDFHRVMIRMRKIYNKSSRKSVSAIMGVDIRFLSINILFPPSRSLTPLQKKNLRIAFLSSPPYEQQKRGKKTKSYFRTLLGKQKKKSCEGKNRKEGMVVRQTGLRQAQTGENSCENDSGVRL